MERTIKVVLVSLAWCGISWAGPVTPPPGPVASTHKTLSEVEPRVAINAVNTPGDTNSQFRITQPGSYYLASNITGVSGRSGIEIAANNVTIDLNGFALVGVTGSLNGMASDGAPTNLAIRNGTISGWGGRGITISTSAINLLVEGVHVTLCGDYGITGSANAILRDCTVAFNTGGGVAIATNGVIVNCSIRSNGGDGITTANGATVIGCSVRDNEGTGIIVGGGSVVRDCSVFSNDDRGIVAGSQVVVEACAVASNGVGGIAIGANSSVVGCIVSGNSGDGVLTSGSCVVSGCTVAGNAMHGIVAVSDSHVVDNACDSNGIGTGGAGIRVTSSDTRVERNTCTDNAIGIEVTASGNFIAANICSGNSSLNWSVVANNKCLVVEAANAGAISGNSGGTSPGSTSAWTNFTF